MLLVSGMCHFQGAKSQESYSSDVTPNYTLAQRFTEDKLKSMLFSTTVDPHWFQKGYRFWYEYKTTDGTNWYVVDPAAKSKRPLFDLDKLAAEVTETMKTPFTARHIPIQKLEVQADGSTFTFQVKTPKDSAWFSYNYDTRKLTELKDKKEDKYPEWASISPDGKTVVYAKDMNLYRMSREDYEKAKKDENDKSIVEIPLTTGYVKSFGFGEPRSLLNTDTLCNGKRRYPDDLVWSPDSRRFAITLADNRAVKELWVINSMAEPRPTLETYKYQMPGEKESPVEYLLLFDLSDNSYKEIKTSAFKDQSLQIARKPRLEKQRDMKEQSRCWLGDSNR